MRPYNLHNFTNFIYVDGETHQNEGVMVEQKHVHTDFGQNMMKYSSFSTEPIFTDHNSLNPFILWCPFPLIFVRMSVPINTRILHFIYAQFPWLEHSITVALILFDMCAVRVRACVRIYDMLLRVRKPLQPNQCCNAVYKIKSTMFFYAMNS